MVNVDPGQLVNVLQRAGFTVAGHGAHHVRLAWPDPAGHQGSLMVPLDTAAPEYEELMLGVQRQLADFVRAGQNIFAELFNHGLTEMLEG
jgi:hypothetical protein